MVQKQAARLASLGSAIFSEVAGWRREAAASGLEVIDLGIGSPDGAPSERVMQALREAVADPANYGYPSSEGSPEFRRTVAAWYLHRFGVKLDPECEVVTLMGSQDGLSHLALAITDPGDTVIVPDPGYPIYSASLALAGVEAYFLPLRRENAYLPRLEEIPPEVLSRTRFLLLNYPSNPAAATADLAFFEELVSFCKQHDILLVHDVAYSELAFGNYYPPSVLQVAGAKDIAVEFHSLSKSFNMAGCRIAFLVGQSEAVAALRTLKSNIDYGVFQAVQQAGIVAMQEDIEYGTGRANAQVYERRRDIFLDILEEQGWSIPRPDATMFIWAPIPTGWTSRQISRAMALEAGVIVIPGDAFGREGEGYVRIALVQDEERLAEAARRIGSFLKKNR